MKAFKALALAIALLSMAQPAFAQYELKAEDQGNGFVKLSWSIPDTNEAFAYQVYRDGAPRGRTFSTEYLDPVQPDETHSYYVLAFNTLGNEVFRTSEAIATASVKSACAKWERNCTDKIDNDCDDSTDEEDDDCGLVQQNVVYLVAAIVLIGTLGLAFGFNKYKKWKSGDVVVAAERPARVWNKPPEKRQVED